MRTALLSLALTVTAALGCGQEAQDEAAVVPQERDLTLAAPAPEVEIVSAVELQRIETAPAKGAHLTARKAPASRPAKTHSRFAPVAALAPAPVPSPAPVTRFANAAYEPVDHRELPPGQTVTVIPASTGSGSGVDAGFSALGSRGSGRGGGSGMGGGKLPGRPGIGIGAYPKPVLY